MKMMILMIMIITMTIKTFGHARIKKIGLTKLKSIVRDFKTTSFPIQVEKNSE